jgi:putative ABC transport system ATP-binding protein
MKTYEEPFTRKEEFMTISPSLACELTEVRKVYGAGDTQVTALASATLAVGADEIVALVGPSGSGKTTLLSVAGGLLTATSGTVVVGGTDISSASAKELTGFRRSTVGFVFQSVNLVPFLTARENLMVVDEIAGRRSKHTKIRAEALLHELGLGHRLNNLPAKLSGGERQRVAIGRALMNQPKLVLFDEPTSALDSTLGDQVMGMIRQEVKSRGTAAIVITHDHRMTHFCDRTVAIADGILDTSTGETAPDQANHLV